MAEGLEEDFNCANRGAERCSCEQRNQAIYDMTASRDIPRTWKQLPDCVSQLTLNDGGLRWISSTIFDEYRSDQIVLVDVNCRRCSSTHGYKQ